jgi:hypothetical protein
MFTDISGGDSIKDLINFIAIFFFRYKGMAFFEYSMPAEMFNILYLCIASGIQGFPMTGVRPNALQEHVFRRLFRIAEIERRKRHIVRKKKQGRIIFSRLRFKANFIVYLYPVTLSLCPISR